MASSNEYRAIPSGLAEESPVIKHEEQRFIYRKFLKHSMFALILTAFFSIIFSVTISALAFRTSTDFSPTFSQETPRLGLSCGNSTAEALFQNCTFDMVGTIWTPSPCVDLGTSEEFSAWLASPERIIPWPFYADGDGQHWLSTVEELAAREHQLVYTTIDYHLGHCVWVWRRMHTSMGQRSYKWPYVWNTPLAHTVHCTNMLLNPSSMSDGNGALDTAFRVSFGSC